MAENILEAADAATRPYPNHPKELAPDECPDTYASLCKGNCLEPVFKDGACLVFSKLHEPENGDFVGIWLHPDDVGVDEHPRRVKRLVTGGWPGMTFPYEPQPGDEVEPIIIAEQLNPPKRYVLKASRVLGMHKVIGEAEPDGSGQARLTRQWINGRMMRCVPEEWPDGQEGGQ